MSEVCVELHQILCFPVDWDLAEKALCFIFS